MRTFAPLVALAVHQRGPFRGRARLVVFAASAVELTADKWPKIGSRWAPLPVAGRMVSASIGGRELDGWTGAGVAAPASVAAAYMGWRFRTSVRGRGAQLAAALAEDVLCYGLALAAVRENRLLSIPVNQCSGSAASHAWLADTTPSLTRDSDTRAPSSAWTARPPTRIRPVRG